VLGLSALAGGMLFFGAIMAPLVFLQLPPDVAGPFIRTAFPWYYGYCAASAAVVALGFLMRKEWISVLVMAGVIAVTGWLWRDLLPALDVMRSAHDAAGFARGHQLAVGVNAAVLLAVTTLLVRVGAWLK